MLFSSQSQVTEHQHVDIKPTARGFITRVSYLTAAKGDEIRYEVACILK